VVGTYSLLDQQTKVSC